MKTAAFTPPFSLIMNRIWPRDGDPSLADHVPHFAQQPGQGFRQRSVDLPGNHQQRIAGAVVDPVVGAGGHGQMAARHVSL